MIKNFQKILSIAFHYDKKNFYFVVFSSFITINLEKEIINIDKVFKRIKPSINFIRYKKYKDNYLKYPGSEDKNSWDVLSKHLIKQGQT